MAKILIKCPRTDRYIFTGIDVPADVFALLPEPQEPVFCPFCRAEHRWRRRDGTPIDPRRWSGVPRAEDCLLRADESAVAAENTTDVRRRELYRWMEQKWLKLAAEFELLAEMDRCHDLTGMAPSGPDRSRAVGET
jgi:hypothetical protein